MKPIFLLSVYTVLVIILPNGMGIKTVIDLRVWMIFAAVLLLPSFANNIFKKKIKLSEVDLILISLVLLSSIFTAFSGSIRQVIGSVIKGSLYILMPYFAGKYFIKSKKNLLVFFYALGLASIIVSLIALGEYFTGKIFFGDLGMINPDDLWINSQIAYQRFGHMRIAASFVHPIYLGTFLGFITLINILMLIYYRYELNLFKKIIVIVSILLAGFATLISQSRSSVVALSIVLILIFLKNYRNIKGMLYFIIPLAIFFLIIRRYLSNYMTDFYYYGVISNQATFNFFSRINTVVISIKNIFNYPNFFGEGMLVHNQLNYFVHNNDLLNRFLYGFLTYGIFYALLYIYLWFKALKDSYNFSKYNILGSVLLFIFIYLFIINNITMLNFQNEIIFYIFLGIIFNPYIRKYINYAK